MKTWAELRAFWRSAGKSNAAAARALNRRFGGGYSVWSIMRAVETGRPAAERDVEIIRERVEAKEAPPPAKPKPAAPTAKRWPIGSTWLDAA